MQNMDTWKTKPSNEIKKELIEPPGPTMSCGQLAGLSTGQMRFCLMYSDHMVSVSLGAKLAIAECQSQFAWKRWNCSTLIGSNKTLLGPTIDVIGE